jgi:hypothetical protein
MATPFQAYAEDERSRTPPNDNPNVNATVHPAAEAAAAATAPTAEPTAHADPAAPKLLELCFRDQHGTEVHFKLKPTTKMKKTMDTFAPEDASRGEDAAILLRGLEDHR